MTTLSLPQLVQDRLNEIHSGDLTSDCDYRTLLRWQGKVSMDAETALFRGSLIDAGIGLMHERDAWTENEVAKCLADSVPLVLDRLIEEGRTITKSVEENVGKIGKKVAKAMVRYAERIGPLVQTCSLVGVQTPLQFWINGQKFATHADVIVRDHENVFGNGEERLTFLELKWREKVNASRAFLARWHQGIQQWMSGWLGELHLGGEWVTLTENAAVAWVDLPSLHVYEKATWVKDDTGERVLLPKGTARPIHRILRWCGYLEANADAMAAYLMEKPRQWRDGHFPKNPNACEFCSAEPFCRRFDTLRLEFSS